MIRNICFPYMMICFLLSIKYIILILISDKNTCILIEILLHDAKKRQNDF